jgi:hypothetical protein
MTAQPNDVLDTVWASAQVEFTTGGTKHVLMPVRYPGTESSQDDDLLFARKTVWDGSDETGWTGMGQRVWTTDAAELMLDCAAIRGQTGAAAFRYASPTPRLPPPALPSDRRRRPAGRVAIHHFEGQAALALSWL